MLTLDLVRVRRLGDSVVPYYVDVEDTRHLQLAQTLAEIYEKHRGQSRQQLDSALESLLGQTKEVLFCRGLSKLLEDRCQFDTPTSLELCSLRKTVFEFASRAHQEGVFERQGILEKASRETGIAIPQIEELLFADLRQNQVIREFNPLSAQSLLRRYNTALAQAVLLKAIRLEIRICEPDHLRYRQLFRAIKFYRLLYQIEGNRDKGFTVILDGPMSLFKGCQKYGLQMALFLPALLLCKNWRMEALIRWGKMTSYLRLTDEQSLKSHYPDVGVYMPPEVAAFEGRFRKLESPWQIDSDCDFLAIGPQEICIPDFVFTHPRGQNVYLEIFGFWHKAALERRLRALAEVPLPILLAVSQNLAGDRESGREDHPQLYYFRQVLSPKEIAGRLDQLQQGRGGPSPSTTGS